MNNPFPITCYNNFYENPDSVREFALSLDYTNNGGFYPGFRTKCLSSISKEFYQESVFKLLSVFGLFDESNTSLEVHSYFQKTWSFSEDPNSILNQGWIHVDPKTILAAVIYLDPNPNIDSGTTMYTLTDNNFGKDEISEQMKKVRYDVFMSTTTCDIDSGKHYEKSLIDNNKQFEKTLEIKNCYNRAIMYNGDQFHAQSSIYNKFDFRLTQIFFVDDLHTPVNNIPRWRCNNYAL